ncbi:inositol-pentakisphosphate 2-kinase-like protein [Babesia ovata]|uniref:Inositol-pentakisphosphate 2-kinase n=1 Tax=Babesia ovata TaxID=189622 RepID=A0A2H6K996_9APIC|nr:inositol-pentakisphosphate 2-kinase-like protein [Babesia ovata]GBE59567.1 inositol-pentakisphosphate 2-kinase-like protein [Babesia ovata]
MKLSPLGAGNCQFVYRISQESWRSTDDDAVPWNHCSVLKLPRKADSALQIRRMLYHDQFCLFMQEGCGNVAESCTPKRVCCLIDRTVAKRLRAHLSQLLDSNKCCRCAENRRCGTSDGLKHARHVCANKCQVNVFNGNVVYKKRIYHIKELALKTSVEVDPASIRVLNSNDAVFDTGKYEVAILEEDLFYLDVCLSLGSTLIQTAMSGYSNISVEMKPKCGMLNFNGMPSLFQLCQPYKARIRYQNIVPTQTTVKSGLKSGRDRNRPATSMYSPIKFFRMKLEDVTRELQLLALAPQNNIRVFVDSVEVDPAILLTNRHALESVARCLVENKLTMARILKLQALASGQQFVANVIYSLRDLVARLGGNKNEVKRRYGDGIKASTITNNLMLTSKELLESIFSNHDSAYKIQKMFNLIGRKLICSLCNMLRVLLLKSHAAIHSSRRNLSVDRVGVAKCRIGNVSYPTDVHKLNRSLAVHSQGKLFKRHSCKDQAVPLVTFNELECMLRTINRSTNPVATSGYIHIANHRNHKVQGTEECSRTVSKHKGVTGETKVDAPLARKCAMLLEAAERWIELYLGGRTSMDLSVVLNVLFQSNGGTDGKGPNFYRFSLIDLDLKPAHRIPRWKEDICYLIGM